MPEHSYQCVDCHRLLMACPRCGHLLHYADELHMDSNLRWCPGPEPIEVNGMEIHPALLNSRAVARDILARRGRAVAKVAG